MFGKKKLTKNPDQTVLMDESASDDQERLCATLLRNELIAGDEDIVVRIMDTAKSVVFTKGKKFIQQGAQDECVYFIVSGRVDVRINNRYIDSRSAPHTVGEMAAKKAGEVRTADVLVSSESLEALVLSGTEFRKLMQDYPKFSDNLNEFIDGFSRQKVSQLGEASKRSGISWVAISGITGAFCAAIAAIVAISADVNLMKILIFTSITGIVAFVCMQIVNPVLRYRNMASFAGYSLVALITYGSFSLMLTIDGKEINLPFIVDFSVQTEFKIGALVVSCCALLALVWISGHFDLKLGANGDRS